MTDDTTRDKVRAAFLAAIMVLSVVAMTATFSGAAFANTQPPQPDLGNTEVDGTEVYSGQDITVGGFSPGNEIQIREVTERDDSDNPSITETRQVKIADSNGDVTFDREFDNGEYVLRDADKATSPRFVGTGGSFANVDSAAELSVLSHSMEFEFGSDTVRQDDDRNQSVDLSWESFNRASENQSQAAESEGESFYINVSEADEELDEEELGDLFQNLSDGASVNANVVDNIVEHDDEDTITLERVEGDITDYGLEPTTEVPVGEYTLEFDVTDSNVESSLDLEVLEELDPDASFTEPQYEVSRGDEVTATLELDGNAEQFNLTVGDEDDVAYEDELEIDTGGEDEVEITINTFFAGQPNRVNSLFSTAPNNLNLAPGTGGLNTAEDYVTQTYTIDSPNDDASIETANTVATVDETVLGAALYDLSVEIDDEEQDVASVRVTERNLGDVNTWTAPDDNGTVQDIYDGTQDLVPDDDKSIYNLIEEGTVTQSDDIAIGNFADRDEDVSSGVDADGDFVIHEVELSGSGGFFASQTVGNASVLDHTDLVNDPDSGNAIRGSLNLASPEGNFAGDLFDFEVQQEDPTANKAPYVLAPTGVNDNAQGAQIGGLQNYTVATDAANDTLFLIADTDEVLMWREDQGISSSTLDNMSEVVNEPSELNATFEFTDDHESLYDRDVDAEGDVDDTTAFDIHELIDRELTFDTIGDEVIVGPADNETISGETSVATGSELRVRARSTGEVSFLRSDTVPVNDDGSFEASVDFGDIPAGTNFTASVRTQSFEDDAETDGTVGEPEGAVFAVSNLAPAEAEVDRGDLITVSANVTNEGDTSENKSVEFRIDGDTIASQDVELDAGAEQEVTFEDIDTEVLEAGDYTHSVFTEDDEAEGSLTVNPVEGTFEVSELDPAEATVTQGDEVTVSATVSNSGAADTKTVELLVDGDSVASQDVEIDAGGSTTVELSVGTGDLEGSFTHTVSTPDSEASGSLTVEVPDEGDDGETEDDGGEMEDDGGEMDDGNQTEDDGTEGDGGADEDGPGFGIAAALLAFIGAALLAVRRRNE